MAKTTRSFNPLAFLKAQVTTIGSLIYVAALVAIIYTHVSVPPAPRSASPVDGINLTQAWRDLEFISDGYHPWSSRRNGEVRSYLLSRLDAILHDVDHKTVYTSSNNTFISDSPAAPALVTVFANDTSNFTAADSWSKRAATLYGESENILVYIRGELEDSKGEGDWWNETSSYTGPSGVLVSAHYDSVSTGFGTTDDGVGVVSILQLVSHFAHNRPKRGIVALLNNGEENGLYGAYNYLRYVHRDLEQVGLRSLHCVGDDLCPRAGSHTASLLICFVLPVVQVADHYYRHPIAQLPHTFVNLEGAGAGGRAMLFRSTDAEITKAYSKSPNPFGNVVSSDGFKRGFIRSGTDYTIFADMGGLVRSLEGKERSSKPPINP